MKILLPLFWILATVGCSRSRSLNPLHAAETVSLFHQRYNVEAFEDACAGSAECAKTLQTAHLLLGPVKSTRLAEPISTTDLLVNMRIRQVHETTYARGHAVERFLWTERGGFAADAYQIDIDFSELAVSQWKAFRAQLAAGSLDRACALTAVTTCREQLTRVTASLGKAEILSEEFAGTVARSRQKPFASNVQLETTSRYANGEARETFYWEVRRQEGFRLVRFDIEPAR